MRLIGLNGRAGSGKDSAFEQIENASRAQGKTARRVAFADKLKLSAALALGFNPKDAAEAVAICDGLKATGVIDTAYHNPSHGPAVLGQHISGREYLQRYGTEAHRDVFGTDFWIDALLPRPVMGYRGGDPERMTRNALVARFPDVDVLVVTDVRFENEARRIRALGGEVWYLDADARLGALPPDAHASERPLPSDCIDTVVYNNCELRAFQRRVVEAFQR